MKEKFIPIEHWLELITLCENAMKSKDKSVSFLYKGQTFTIIQKDNK